MLCTGHLSLIAVCCGEVGVFTHASEICSGRSSGVAVCIQSVAKLQLSEHQCSSRSSPKARKIEKCNQWGYADRIYSRIYFGTTDRDDSGVRGGKCRSKWTELFRNLCTNETFRDLLRRECFFELKMSNLRTSCTVIEVRRSSWKVLWVTK